MEHSPILVPKA